LPAIILFMGTTKIFKSGNSLAVRLPRDLAFGEGEEVTVSREGESLIIRPLRMKMAELVRRLGASPPPSYVERLAIKSPRRLELKDERA
jgi:antitoxin VapB